jgi:hypothetical protein
MAKGSGSSFHLEWFNVSYRSVLLAILVVILAGGGGAAYWYYSSIHSPRSEAEEAIRRADRRLGEATRLQAEDRMAEIVESAGVALREARQSYDALRYDDARVAAIRSENLSLKALAMARGQDVDERLVRFYRIEGDVRVKKRDEFSWEAADSDMLLEIGDSVKTSSSASAQLIYFDGTVTTIQPGSLLEIRELYENPVTKVRRVREKLNRGELTASTQEKNVEGSYHEVATETEKVSAKTDEESEFRVAYDPEKKTAEFDVFEGRIEVAAPTRRESLVAGERIRSTGNGRLSDKEVLPGVPRLVSPRDQKVFISDGGSAQSITLSWERVPGAGSYRLTISDKALFTASLYDAEREGTQAVLDGVGDGSYYWKVAAISGDITGRFSEPRRFRVSTAKIRDREDTDPPSVEITEFVSIGLMVIVNGRTEPGSTLWIDNEKVDVDDDGTFYQVVRLRKEGLNEVRFVAQDTAGNETVLTRSTYVEMY